MLSQEHFIGYVTTTLNNTFANNFETNGASYMLITLVSGVCKIRTGYLRIADADWKLRIVKELRRTKKNNNNNNEKQQKTSLIWTYNFRRRILGCYTDILKITEDMFWKLFR